KEIFKEINCSPCYVIMIRNPIDVAESLRRGSSSPRQRAMRIWMNRTLLSLMGTAGENRIIIDYQYFLKNSYECLSEMARTFHFSWRQDDSYIKKQLNTFIDPAMQHSQTNLQTLMKQRGIG